MTDTVDPAELRTNLSEYEDQLRQVEELLLDDPENEEYLGIYEGLAEVVNLTKEVLAEALQQEQAAVAAPQGPSTSAPVAAITSAPEVRVPSVLPPQVAQQIRIAQQRAALAGQGPAAWAIGAKVQARYSGDGLWYDAMVSGISVAGNFIVNFEAYGNVEEVQRHDLKSREEVTNTATEYKGVEAPKRKKVSEEQTEMKQMPKWLEIKPTDDEKTKAKKKKLSKSFKSKQRFQQMDIVQKEKADAWKSFVSKGVKKKSGFMTGRKKNSMFSVAEGSEAKVGVVGSGKGMTGYGKKKRHEFDINEAGGGQGDE